MSAYDKFDYAKEAINLGVLEYLNKPFNQKSIVAVVNQAIAVLDERRAKRSQDLENKEKLETVVPIIENGFCTDGKTKIGSKSGDDKWKKAGIALLVIFILAIIGAVIYIILDLRKKNNDKEKNKNELNSENNRAISQQGNAVTAK